MTRLLILPLLLLAACTGEPETPTEADPTAPASEVASATFGDTVPDGEALTPAALIADAETYDGKTVVVEGIAREVCQNAGCWLTFSDDKGRVIRINVPRDESENYVYTFPTDAAGRTVRVAGMLEVTTESVEDQRHYAEDGGASPEALAAITEPKQTLVLTALGAELADDTAPASGA